MTLLQRIKISILIIHLLTVLCPYDTSLAVTSAIDAVHAPHTPPHLSAAEYLDNDSDIECLFDGDDSASRYTFQQVIQQPDRVIDKLRVTDDQLKIPLVIFAIPVPPG